MERWLAGPDDVLLEEWVESAWNDMRDCLDG
jgi:hypothetical protein